MLLNPKARPSLRVFKSFSSQHCAPATGTRARQNARQRPHLSNRLTPSSWALGVEAHRNLGPWIVQHPRGLRQPGAYTIGNVHHKSNESSSHSHATCSRIVALEVPFVMVVIMKDYDGNQSGDGGTLHTGLNTSSFIHHSLYMVL